MVIIYGIGLDIIGLYRHNYFSQFHVREMAKLVGKSHVSLLPYLRDFEKNKVFLSRQVGKSKVYYINFDNNQVREFLSIAEKKKTLELLDKEFLLKKFYNEFINLDCCLVLFGSYASGRYTKESDIDLLCIGMLSEDKKRAIKEFGKTYAKETHLVLMTLKQFREQLAKQSPLIKEAIKNHIILYNHDTFINEVWRYYYEKREK